MSKTFYFLPGTHMLPPMGSFNVDSVANPVCGRGMEHIEVDVNSEVQGEESILASLSHLAFNISRSANELGIFLTSSIDMRDNRRSIRFGGDTQKLFAILSEDGSLDSHTIQRLKSMESYSLGSALALNALLQIFVEKENTSNAETTV